MKRKVKIKNEKGLELAAIVESPDFENEHAAVMLLQGFTGYKEEKHIVDLAEKLLQNDIALIRFDYSGYGESDGTVDADYRFSNIIDDVEVVYEFFSSQDYVDNNRMGLFGCSMGGQLAMVHASKNKAIKAVCLVSPPDIASDSDLGEIMEEWKKQGYYEMESSKYGTVKLPFEVYKDLSEWNMLDYTSKVNVPLLVILGKKDVNVYPEQTKKIFKAANEPKELIEFDEMDHFYKKDPGILEKVNGAVIKFFKNKLK